MGGLLGYAQLLNATADGLNPDEIREYSGMIINEMRRLSGLTEEIMDFSRGLDKKLNLREMEPPDLINTAWPVIQQDLVNNGMSLVREEAEPTARVMVDSDKLERVLINLAVNARQAMDEGGSLTIAVKMNENWVELSFRDTGKGIPENIREKIFEPFVTRKKGSSLGIGLAMARWIVQAHQGELEIGKTGPDGTEMIIRLPQMNQDGKDGSL